MKRILKNITYIEAGIKWELVFILYVLSLLVLFNNSHWNKDNFDDSLIVLVIKILSWNNVPSKFLNQLWKLYRLI